MEIIRVAFVAVAVPYFAIVDSNADEYEYEDEDEDHVYIRGV